MGSCEGLVFQGWVLHYVGPESAVSGVTDGLKEAAKERRRNHLRSYGSGDTKMDRHVGSIGLGFRKLSATIRCETSKHNRKCQDTKFPNEAKRVFTREEHRLAVSG